MLLRYIGKLAMGKCIHTCSWIGLELAVACPALWSYFTLDQSALWPCDLKKLSFLNRQKISLHISSCRSLFSGTTLPGVLTQKSNVPCHQVQTLRGSANNHIHRTVGKSLNRAATPLAYTLQPKPLVKPGDSLVWKLCLQRRNFTWSEKRCNISQLCVSNRYEEKDLEWKKAWHEIEKKKNQIIDV